MVAENPLVLVWASNLAALLVCDRNGLDFILEHRNRLDFRVGIELIWFSSGVDTNLIFVWGIEFGLVSVLVSKVTCLRCEGSKFSLCRPKWICFECNDWLTWFLCGINWHGFWIRAANRLVLVWTLKLTWVLSGLSILTWFKYLGRNWLGFCVMMFDRK